MNIEDIKLKMEYVGLPTYGTDEEVTERAMRNGIIAKTLSEMDEKAVKQGKPELVGDKWTDEEIKSQPKRSEIKINEIEPYVSKRGRPSTKGKHNG